jgi:hypothetical protein
MERGDAVPHFTVTTVDGERTSYASSIWQQKTLVLVTLDRSAEPNDYAARIKSAVADAAADTAIIVTREAIPTLPAPAAVVADRWGEIVHIVRPEHAGGLPDPKDLAAWVDHLRQRCPECEGETR